MKKIISFFLLFLFYKCKEIKYSHTNNEANLYFVFTSFRHGARKSYVKYDVFKNKIEDPDALTSYGQKQHLEIGKKYRKRYFNFLHLDNKNFDKEQIYIRSSLFPRTVISTKKQIEGLFNNNHTINDSNIDYIIDGANDFNLYNFKNISEKIKILIYLRSCGLRDLNAIDYNETFIKTIIPLFNNCFGKLEDDNVYRFCDNTISAFFEYSYNNQKNNSIGKCGYKTAEKLYNFCNDFLNSYRGWSESSAYVFYIFFKDLFKYMKDAIDGTSNLKMMMFGGHDSTMAPLMNFFDGLNIINRTEYPHYAFNIVFELRKYLDEFYLEIYYNDVLKYNETLTNFKNILNNSKYNKLTNFCGTPTWEKKDSNVGGFIDMILNKVNYYCGDITVPLYILISFVFICYIIKKNNKNIKNNIEYQKLEII